MSVYIHIHKIYIHIYMSNWTKLKQESNFKYTILRILCSDMKIRWESSFSFTTNVTVRKSSKHYNILLKSQLLSPNTEYMFSAACITNLSRSALAHQALSQCWLHFRSYKSLPQQQIKGFVPDPNCLPEFPLSSSGSSVSGLKQFGLVSWMNKLCTCGGKG